MDMILSITSCAVSMIALVIAAVTFKNSRISIVKEFFRHGDSDEQKKYRQIVYHIYNNEKDSKRRLERLKESSHEAAAIISFYDFWAIMVSKKYLPIWTFYGIAGTTAENVYTKLMPYIAFRREQKGYELYGMAFERLVNKIKTLNANMNTRMLK